MKFMLTLVFLVFSLTSVMAQEQETTTQSQPAVAAAPQSSGDFDQAMRLYKQRRYNDAIAEFQQVVDADPKNAAAYYMLGYAHYVLDHHSDALAAFDKAFEADPNFDPRPLFRR